MSRFLVLGAGFTGSRVVRLLESSHATVTATSQTGKLGTIQFDYSSSPLENLLPLIRDDTVILHSIPTVRNGDDLEEYTPQLVRLLRRRPPRRMVYLSTTGVYGPACEVDEHTSTNPRTTREKLRVEAEGAVLSGPWSSFILRPAAIYGPGRGIHASMRAGQFRLPANPSNFVSRIHVDDLAMHCQAALNSSDEGAYPVADQDPCTSLEAAQFCADLLNIPLPQSVPVKELGETRRADRRVDGSAVRSLLGISLRYPSYKVGFPACLEEEMRARSMS